MMPLGRLTLPSGRLTMPSGWLIMPSGRSTTFRATDSAFRSKVDLLYL
jgi:hypothetical protein